MVTVWAALTPGQSRRDAGSAVVQCWASVSDAGPALNHSWAIRSLCVVDHSWIVFAGVRSHGATPRVCTITLCSSFHVQWLPPDFWASRYLFLKDYAIVYSQFYCYKAMYSCSHILWKCLKNEIFVTKCLDVLEFWKIVFFNRIYFLKKSYSDSILIVSANQINK